MNNPFNLSDQQLILIVCGVDQIAHFLQYLSQNGTNLKQYMGSGFEVSMLFVFTENLIKSIGDYAAVKLIGFIQVLYVILIKFLDLKDGDYVLKIYYIFRSLLLCYYYGEQLYRKLEHGVENVKKEREQKEQKETKKEEQQNPVQKNPFRGYRVKSKSKKSK